MKKKNLIIILMVALLCGTLGYLLGTGTKKGLDDASSSSSYPVKEAAIWTCSMHPQIRESKPGKCPICAMELIPVPNPKANNAMSSDENSITLSQEALALADVETWVVRRQKAAKEISLSGQIEADERRVQSQTAHVSGRIEKLYIDFTGQVVKQGQTLATIYSPELVTAQQELLEALKMKETQPRLLDAAREKLKRWKFTDEQIHQIEVSNQVSTVVAIQSNSKGIISAKRVNQGDYVKMGTVLYEVDDLSKVWAVFNAFEEDLPFLHVGDPISFHLKSAPNEVQTGVISFINPLLDASTRTAQVRMEVKNDRGVFKPEMYITGNVNAPLEADSERIVLPKSAVLWTGKRSIVYVQNKQAPMPTFELREIELGPSLGDAYVVLNGLKLGETVVSKGVFAIDASAQLAGKRSMMNEEAP